MSERSLSRDQWRHPVDKVSSVGISQYESRFIASSASTRRLPGGAPEVLGTVEFVDEGGRQLLAPGLLTDRRDEVDVGVAPDRPRERADARTRRVGEQEIE